MRMGFPKSPSLSRHVTIGVSMFPGVQDLDNYMETESDCDDSFVDESDEFERK